MLQIRPLSALDGGDFGWLKGAPAASWCDPAGGRPVQVRAAPARAFLIRLGVARVCEISFAFFFGNPFEKRGDCAPKLLNSAGLHFA